MSEFTKYPLPEQLHGGHIPETTGAGNMPRGEIDFYVQRGKSLHSRAIRSALFAGFCSVGKAADRISATIGQAVRKQGHSPS